MDLTKSFEYFDPYSVDRQIHIIGCGSVGSTIAENLARLGIENFVLYDFDKVEAKNIANQMFVNSDVGTPKVEATKRLICSINPEAETRIEMFPEGYTGQKLNGYVFLCVDNIELRKAICERNKMNRQIKAVFDFRTRLEDAQCYAANWADLRQVRNLIDTMDFTHEEAKAATPTSACGVVLGVAPTVRMVCTLGVCNFMNFVKTEKLRPVMVCNPFAGDIFS